VTAARRALVAAAWVVAYAGAVLYAASFIRTQDQVVLFWPAAGIALALVIHHGVRWAWLVLPGVALGMLLIGTWMTPAPLPFLPWAMAANFLGAVCGGWVARRGLARRRGWLADGMQAMLGGLVLAATSALIGASGMWTTGMISAAQWPQGVVRWTLGDVLGVVCIAPALVLGIAHLQRPARPGPATLTEGLLWNVALLLSFLLMTWGSTASDTYALGLSALPLAVMLWSAVRFTPLRTALATLLTILLLGSLAGLGLAGFRAGQPTFEVAILLLYLSLMSVVPMIVSLTVAEHRATVRKLMRQIDLHPLSGLPNRGAFEARARQALLDPATGPLALAYIDLDNLKLVNDTASHEAGDALIVAVANALRTRLREGDLLAQMGGDEFVVLLRNVSPAAAQEQAKALLRTIAGCQCAFGEERFGTTASIGVVQFQPDQLGFAQALSQADAACFRAKEHGGDRVWMAGSADADPTSAMRWTVRIREALQNDDLLLYAQSIAPLHASMDQRIHFELLLRMRDVRGGNVHLPERFIPAAERFHLAPRIDRKVVRMAIDWLEAQPQFRQRMAMCFINLSAGTLLDEGFTGFIAERLRGSSVDASSLCFEITETSAMRDPARAQRVMDALRGSGCRFALDDFGTGFCSFSQLRSLDVDFIKIDGSFVREMQASALASEVVRSTTRIAHLLHKRAIAEHTESAQVRALLAELGVDYAQGYAIDRPQPLEQFAAARMSA
jgi:diguanylate cyclase (GGDEF)-like protein